MTIDTIAKAAEIIAESKIAIALTGAGISVDSGVPDFRSPGGLWERYDPMEYAHIQSFHSNPERVWNLIHEMRDVMGSAAPNPAHRALAELEAMHQLDAIITQNIDNLHQEAGSRDVIEFHGNAKRFVCLECEKRYGRADIESGLLGDPPRCDCGRILKPDFIFFGEAIPRDALTRSFDLASKADVMLILGTSAQVAPANMLPSLVLQGGGRLIEINLERTHLSRESNTLHISGSTTVVLPEIVEKIKRHTL